MRIHSAIKALDALLEGQGLGFLSAILDIVLAFTAATLAVALVKHGMRLVVRQRSKRLDRDRLSRLETASILLVSAAKYTFYFIAIAVSVGALGLSSAMNSMLAAAGIGGIALSIGAQSVLRDIAAGFSLIFEGVLVVGDYVAIGEVTGTVEAVSLRTTSIRGYRGELNIIPNGQIAAITNYSREDYLALVDMRVSYEADASRAMALMLEEAERYCTELGDEAVGRPSMLGVAELRESSVVLRLGMRVKPLKQWEAQRELMLRFKNRFESEGITAAYPRMIVTDSGQKDPGPDQPR